MEQATLTTARLLLVPLADEHLDHEVELDADPEVMRYLAHGPSSRETTEQAHRDRIEQARSLPGMGLWAGFADGQFVGWWLLRPRSRNPEDREIELGYRLLRRFWRQGLAAKAAASSSATPSRTSTPR
ncbi:acetyltransferase (GNAT) family protein [Actinomycetospora succinea]|uniref:Acetyltransferase (GNAT) family protein n=1 Tax=Actinomycetospora succinea TaxID=663603 RepID=A0A4R6UGI6_9PSEU|nr:GNAT family N-acetyltransferase [Actinomycetospora succinea]TDQ45940.1 acetyltransferase (GNAT) family protein [Actinomycetospora succinea]